MSAIRVSFVFGKEDEFGKGKGADKPWIAPPPGAYISTDHSRSTTVIRPSGTKTWDTVAYNKLAGSFTITFALDYDYLELFYLAFEGYSQPKEGWHRFQKLNNKRVSSFCIRRKILNYMAGGPEGSDEIVELRGCVIRNVSYSKAGGASQTNITMTGFYSDEKMITGNLPGTDYQEYNGHLAEFMCMYTNDNDGKGDVYVSNVESLGVSVQNNSNQIYNTCSPFASMYFEGVTDYGFNATCYSNDPEKFKKRVYSGGKKHEWNANNIYPLSKGMAPIPTVKLQVYDGYMDQGYDTPEEAMENSERRMIFTLTDVVIKSLTWPKGEGNQITDNISSTEFKYMTIDIKSPVKCTMDADDSHVVESPDPL